MSCLPREVAAAALLAGCAAAWSAWGQVSAVATVDGVQVTAAELDQAVALAVRERFYHRRPSDAALAALRSEVTERLIDRAVLLSEARRRGIAPDAGRVKATLAALDERNAANPQWRRTREATLPGLTRWLEEESEIEQLESRVRDVAPMGEAELRAYYDTHPALFTEPEQIRLSVILLKVDPAAPKVTREKALEEARAILRRLRSGADFAELARLHSGDAASARNGGDMGYLHRGILPEGLHGQIDSMQPGSLSEPVALLEGVALFRLEDRRAARLRSYEDVRQRAAELARREAAEQTWKRTIAGLRARAVVEKNGVERLP